MISIFREWTNLVDKNEAKILLSNLAAEYSKKEIYPNKEDVFKAFRLLTPDECRVVFVGQDPYPQRGIATGVAFANKMDTPEEDYSPSLKVIKNSIKNLENPNLVYTFDPTLEYWVKQGVLMLNASLTVEANKIGSHTMLWRRFISKFITNLSKYNNNLIFVLFGELANTFAPYIFSGTVIKVKHPAYYARNNEPMPEDVFLLVNRHLENYGTKIEWCQSV